MTVVQLIEALLKQNWTKSISGRYHDVPQPLFVREKSQLQDQLRTQDVAYVRDAGDEDHTPLGFGWTHQTVEAVVAVELRSADRRVEGTTTDGRIRTLGYRNTTGGTDQFGLSNLESERWGGLAGESKRILLDNRKGVAEFDIVGDDLRVQDVSGNQGGTKYYRADVVVPLTNLADSIDTST